MSTKIERNNWIFGYVQSELPSKAELVREYFTSMLNRTTRIFRYTGLPDTIPAKDLETYLQVGGYAIFGKDPKGDLYVYSGGLGGEPNPYYLPTIATVANPALNFSKNYVIDKDCVVMRNDDYYQGLRPILNKYSVMLVEAEISMKYAILNARVPSLIQADNDKTYKSAEEFFKKIREGSDYGIIASQEFFEGIQTQSFYSSTYIKDLIEAIQYIKGSLFNEIGLQAQFSMKREAINEAEASMNDDILKPLIDTMLENRQQALEKVNDMFGTNITVELDSIWEVKDETAEIERDILEKEADSDATERHTDTTGNAADSAKEE